MTTRALPTGRAGRWLALSLLVLLGALVWLAVAAPLMDWYADRADRLGTREVLAGRMAALAAAVPSLERQAAAGAGTGPAAGALLDQPSDAVAAAVLQGRVGEMVAGAGASLSSMEVLPAEAAGAYRRIRLRVALSGDWPVLVALLRAIGEATPRMLLDDVQLRAAPVLAGGRAPPLDAGFTVLAFRSVGPGDRK